MRRRDFMNTYIALAVVGFWVAVFVTLLEACGV